jgi:hypothetical protein
MGEQTGPPQCMQTLCVTNGKQILVGLEHYIPCASSEYVQGL